MFDRAKKIDEGLCEFLRTGATPDEFTRLGDLDESTKAKLVDIFESQLISRLLDIKARKLRAQGKSFYTIGSSGHEGMAVVGEVSRLTDMAFLHYRDAAFQIQRSKKNPGHTIIHDMLLSFCASSADPISGGRHKVLGSKELFIPPQTSTIASHLPKAVGAALSIEKAKRLGTPGPLPEDAVIIATFGDASLNHASSQTALNTADWVAYQNLPLPLVFICEDNGIGISVRSPQDWVKSSRKRHAAIKYFECDGLDIIDTYNIMTEAFDYARSLKKPVFVRCKTVRLMGHAGSDIETVYRSMTELDRDESRDPILRSAKTLIGNRILSHQEALSMYEGLRERIDRVAEAVVLTPPIKTAEEVMKSLIPVIKNRVAPPAPQEDQRAKIFGNEWAQIATPQSLAKLINWGLHDILLRYREAVVFGEDVARKGGVYNVTANLESRFGKNKVFNSLLDETSILGNAIGLAHNNLLPIPEIQFLAYVHNAEDQIRGEAATLSFFSDCKYHNGMVIRIAGLGYQKGFGGHFHNDNSLAIFRDIPGLIVACPSNGRDAVLMMRECVEKAYEYGRVVVFIEPIALYPVRDLHAAGDGQWSFTYPKDLTEKIALGEYGVDQGDKSLCILSYGNGHYLSRQAKKVLQDEHKLNPTLIDLRWFSPIDEAKLSRELSGYSHVLVVEECRKTGSLSEGLMTMMMEHCSPLPKIKRVCSLDSFIPLADAANLVLVQPKDIVNAALALTGKGK